MPYFVIALAIAILDCGIVLSVVDVPLPVALCAGETFLKEAI